MRNQLIYIACFVCVLSMYVRVNATDAEIVYTDNLPPTEMTAANPTPTPAPEREIIITEYSKYEYSETEATLWELMNRYAPNEYAAAAGMGMFFRESRYKSDALCGWASCYPEFPRLCEDFTADVDAGLADGSSYEYYAERIHNVHGGFGLCTWYSYDYLERLYAFAQEWGTSIADAEMQCAFLYYDIENNVPELWQELLNAPSPQIAGERMGQMYDHTCEWDSIGSFARDIYWRNHVA